MSNQDLVHTIKQVSTVEELAGLLTQHVWSATSGFALDGTLFLNISTSPGVMQEYAVIQEGRRLESITIDGLDAEAAHALVVATLAKAKERGRVGVALGGADNSPSA